MLICSVSQFIDRIVRPSMISLNVNGGFFSAWANMWAWLFLKSLDSLFVETSPTHLCVLEVLDSISTLSLVEYSLPRIAVALAPILFLVLHFFLRYLLSMMFLQLLLSCHLVRSFPSRILFVLVQTPQHSLNLRCHHLQCCRRLYQRLNMSWHRCVAMA